MSIYNSQANQIQKNATVFLNDKNIKKILEKFGKVVFFGSYTLNLMNRNDIDLVLLVDSIDISIVTSLIDILNSKGFNRHWVFDNTNGGCSTDPKHIVYEAVYGFYNEKIAIENRWELGIVIAKEDMLEDILMLTKKVSQFSEEQKSLILDLKFGLAKEFGEHKYTGSQIYKAVSEGITTIEEFLTYLKSNN